MLRKTLSFALAAALVTLALASNVHAWGGYHVGYTHYSPYTGVHHYGYTRAYGGGYGGAHYGSYGAHYGSYGGYHYGGYHYGGYHYGGYGYGGGGAHYGYYRRY